MSAKPIFCSKIAQKSKTCSRLLEPQKVSCFKRQKWFKSWRAQSGQASWQEAKWSCKTWGKMSISRSHLPCLLFFLSQIFELLIRGLSCDWTTLANYVSYVELYVKNLEYPKTVRFVVTIFSYIMDTLFFVRFRYDNQVLRLISRATKI